MPVMKKIQETWVQSLGQKISRGGMATHPSIPWTEESDGLQSMGSQRVGHDQAQHNILFVLILIFKNIIDLDC